MAGFPQRPPRSAWGNRKINGADILEPDVQLGADPLNLLFDQSFGAGMTVPLAVMKLSFTDLDGLGTTFQADFGSLRSLNGAGNQGIRISPGPASTHWHVDVDRYGIPDQNGNKYVLADILANTALSDRVILPLGADIQMSDEAPAGALVIVGYESLEEFVRYHVVFDAPRPYDCTMVVWSSVGYAGPA